ncbi:hypothetical protein PILCRDRAFT_688541 [Piloderma croceum F 1598]|uniref:Uncharacterized protein n=1 Tax=Piloderma croceum (strain F 1598) TaxID=765440 RepID=A0A0C3F5H9_PILCF|nr:hypothetical protein PILCRDRAFT_688541 [Piloderma croceum F 1598]
MPPIMGGNYGDASKLQGLYKNAHIVGTLIALTVWGTGPIIRAPSICHVRGMVLSLVEHPDVQH